MSGMTEAEKKVRGVYPSAHARENYSGNRVRILSGGVVEQILSGWRTSVEAAWDDALRRLQGDKS